LGIGDWGLGIGDWGLGIGPNPQVYLLLLDKYFNHLKQYKFIFKNE